MDNQTFAYQIGKELIASVFPFGKTDPHKASGSDDLSRRLGQRQIDGPIYLYSMCQITYVCSIQP